MDNDQIHEARASGLTDDEIEYLRRPVKAARYSERHGISQEAIEKMINLGQLRGVLSGTVLWVQDKAPQEPGPAISAERLLQNLWEGNLGLATTYWVYGVLGGFFWAVAIVAMNIAPGSDAARIALLLMGAYYFVVYVGIWRAASAYSGNKLWAVMAKFVVVITVLPIAIQLLKSTNT